ncbi:GH25 family lysozyme [Clostridium autoethanogenum]|uniref:Glycosyl hydrolase n=1 Tax=Clostridium autoethanogenum DSM 10061 TaxID=1341692 RepID=A0ABM5NZA6_9CLOT|nr:GH25 family lysozyme [Clostridium autoethanogenum]AGY78000.1 glycosyl hydrolase [Clostridium autoethanogenum DSM 10061]ALU38134.1 Autolytic lysozyme [Clostridium autoethanogenum DSM 10061]OVY50898.1 Autolytic lysozyme [Clostridium autoethanogenum]
MKGIDISNNDGSVNFQAVKDAGYEICYIKSTEGLTYNDSMMRTFYNGCKDVGLKVGFYHFLRKNDPKQEAIHFLNCISGLAYDCIPMIDVEHDSLKDGSALGRTQSFANYCESQGVKVGLYTYTSFLKESMNNDSLGLSLWIAEYGVNSPHTDKEYVGFQYSETGKVPGVSTNCDLDDFNEKIFVSGGIKKVKNIVCINNSVDERAAGYLADFLQCPIIDNSLVKFDYSCVENIYCVGGGQFTEHATKIIKGQTRYDTCQAVLDFIKNGGK